MTDSETAAHLRQAAAVMHEHGLARQQYITPIEQRVCLEGAIRVAVLTLSARDTELLWSVTNMPRTPAVVSAVNAVASVLPEICSCGAHVPAEPESRVYHFNDFHCTGSNGARDLLIEAAEKLEANTPEGIHL